MNEAFYMVEQADLDQFVGRNQEHLSLIMNLFPHVKLIFEGNGIKVVAKSEDSQLVLDILREIEERCLEARRITDEEIIDIVRSKTSSKSSQTKTESSLILHGLHGKAIQSRGVNQTEMVRAFEKHDLMFAIGPAGSGKTFVAICLAVKALKNKQVRRIILSRPAVEAGEKLGFLPGEMKDKLDPYLHPLYDALGELIPSQKLKDYIDLGTIQIAPLAFMRGRTLSDAVVILDEAQNTTPLQMKMFLTRLGNNSKMIVTGDVSQVDLPNGVKSGLKDAVEKLSSIEGVSLIQFDKQDIVRHPLVQSIVEVYEETEDKNRRNIQGLHKLTKQNNLNN